MNAVSDAPCVHVPACLRVCALVRACVGGWLGGRLRGWVVGGWVWRARSACLLLLVHARVGWLACWLLVFVCFFIRLRQDVCVCVLLTRHTPCVDVWCVYVHVVRCCDNTADALTTTTTIGKEVEDSCVGSLIEPCHQSKGLSLQTVSKKDCMAAAVSGGSACQISSDSCFKTFYNLCQTAR
jgi:hypothetical protein